MQIGLKKPFNIPFNILKTSIFGLGTMMMALVIFSPYIPESITLDEGDIANKTIVSPRFIEFESVEDKVKTDHLREDRAKNVPDIYTIDPNINKEIISSIIDTFTQISKKRENIEQPLPESLRFLSTKDLQYILALDAKSFSAIEYVTRQTTEKLLNEGLRDINEPEIRLSIQNTLNALQLPSSNESIINKIILHYIVPNKVFNSQETQSLIEEQIQSITPFTTKIKEGEPIVYKGSIVTKKQIEVLEALNLYGVSASLLKFFGIALITLFLFILIERFLFYFYQRIHKQFKFTILIYTVILLIVTLARIMQEAHPIQGLNLYYLIPISISSMLLSLLVTPNISLLAGTVTSLLISLMYQADFSIFVYLFLSNSAAAFATYKKTSRSELIGSGYITGSVNMVLVLALGLFAETPGLLWFGLNMLIAFFNGILSSMISLAVIPYFESLFNITTQQSLFELSNLNHPLLKRLLATAPGTYQHSLMVANLSETAAEAIDADPVLCRVGSFYHDIGKMKRPLFFTENQFSGENPHATLTPRMSKIIISSHTKDGLEMAKKYKLPNIIQDFIAEHHGTTLVSFFYSQAVKTENLEHDESSKNEFRYPGPKPHFKESGIVMFADSVEAAVKSLDKPTPSKIEQLIDKIFNEKIEDGQMDDCPLSLKEIDTIKESFIKVFNGIHHKRIDYQEELMALMNENEEKPLNHHD